MSATRGRSCELAPTHARRLASRATDSSSACARSSMPSCPCRWRKSVEHLSLADDVRRRAPETRLPRPPPARRDPSPTNAVTLPPSGNSPWAPASTRASCPRCMRRPGTGPINCTRSAPRVEGGQAFGGEAPRLEQRACGQHASLATRAAICLTAFRAGESRRASELGSRLRQTRAMRAASAGRLRGDAPSDSERAVSTRASRREPRCLYAFPESANRAS
jgi:hypothetical protein